MAASWQPKSIGKPKNEQHVGLKGGDEWRTFVDENPLAQVMIVLGKAEDLGNRDGELFSVVDRVLMDQSCPKPGLISFWLYLQLTGSVEAGSDMATTGDKQGIGASSYEL
jgi:hypothetical protein